jgi:hypothetical protein
LKEVIILGAGSSIQTGIDTGLWNKIRGKDIWSLNSMFKIMPYNPTRQIWVDVSFFRHEVAELQRLFKEGVELHCKSHTHYSFISQRVNQYPCCREREFYKEPMKEVSHIFIGGHGLVGLFSLSLAVKEEYDNIYLLGFDWGTKSNNERKTHVYQDKIKDLNIRSTGAGKPGIYLKEDDSPNNFIKDFNIYKKEKSKIWNVSPDSNIEIFEKIDYNTLYEKIK